MRNFLRIELIIVIIGALITSLVYFIKGNINYATFFLGLVILNTINFYHV